LLDLYKNKLIGLEKEGIKRNNMKIFLFVLAVVLIVGSFFAGTRYSESKMTKTNNEKDSVYNYTIDSLERKVGNVLVEFYLSRTEVTTLKEENKKLKNAYEQEKKNDHTYVFNSPIDSTIKYWTDEFSKIRNF